MPIRNLLVASLLLACTSPLVFGQDKLPRSPQPYQALAVVDEAGKITLKRELIQLVPITTPDPRNKGAMVTRYVSKAEMQPVTFPQDKFHAFDVRGNRIMAKRLRKLLNEERPVLVSADGAMVDSLHLRLYKDDVIVLVIPGAAVSPPIGAADIPLLDKYYPPIDAPKKSSDLQIEVRGSTEAKVHTDTQFIVRVANSGNALVRGVRLRVDLPTHVMPVPPVVEFEGENAIWTTLPDLKPGEMREVPLTLRPEKVGKSRVTVTVLTEGGGMQTTSWAMNVSEQPAKGEMK